jgi:hypothetical protein
VVLIVAGIVVIGGILVTPIILTLRIIEAVSPGMVTIWMLPAVVLTVLLVVLMVLMGLMSFRLLVPMLLVLWISFVK